MNDVAELLASASRLLEYAAEAAEKNQPFNAMDSITEALARIAKAKRPLRIKMDERMKALPSSRLSYITTHDAAKEAA